MFEEMLKNEIKHKTEALLSFDPKKTDFAVEYGILRKEILFAETLIEFLNKDVGDISEFKWEL